MRPRCEISVSCVLNVCKANESCVVKNCSLDTKKELKDFVEGREKIRLIGYTSDSVSTPKFRPPEDVSNFISPKKKDAIDYKLDVFSPKKSVRKKVSSPIQELPITIENFFISTYGMFDELSELPTGFVKFFGSKVSDYYTNETKDTLIRVSDHWGYSIRYCSWHLKGYEQRTSWMWQKNHGKEKRIGKILIEHLKANPAFHNGSGKQIIKQIDKLESRHPF